MRRLTTAANMRASSSLQSSSVNLSQALSSTARSSIRRRPTQDSELSVNLRTVAERRIARLNQLSQYSRRVTEFLVREPAPHRVPMGVVARALALSERSLHRRLADSGTSYSAIASEVAATIAKRLLVEQNLTIKQAAHQMGFSNASAFHRAFKRWTGRTPQSYRRPT